MNVDINKEVQREMMSPTEDQGIVKLLASELKLRDAQARKQIQNLMAPSNSDSIMAQNEKEVENNVRQEIAQKMQARVMQERQAQARQRQTLAGIAGQRASNMQMAASGGIVGYAEGGPPQEDTSMLDKIKAGLGGLFGGGEKEQPAPFDVEARVIELLRLREGADAEAKARIDQELSGFDSDTVMSARQRMSQGMQAGGIVGLQEGGMPRFPRLFDFSMFLAERGIDSLAGLSADAVNRLRQEYEAMQAREMDRPRGDSVSESQMENLRGVVKGGLEMLVPEVLSPDERSPGSPGQMAGDRLQDAPGIVESMAETGRGMPRANLGDSPRLEIPKTNLGRSPRGEGIERVVGGIANLVPEGKSDLQRELEAAERRMQAEQGTDSLGIASRALDPRIGGAPQARRGPSAADLADAQSEMDILNAAQRRQDQARQRQGLESLEYYDPAEGVKALKRAAAETRAIRVDEPEEGLLGQLGRLFRPSSAQRAANRAGDAERQRQRDILDEPGLADRFVDYATRPLDELDYYDPNAPKGTDEEAAQVAQEIIDTGVTPEQFDEAYRMGERTTTPTTPTIDRGAIDAASALAREVETAPSGAEGAARAASVITGRGGEVAAAELASTVAQNPTPENTSRFESEIQRLMERRESPVRALSSFLTSFSQARGGSMGQNLAIATTAMRAADDALDKQIVELEKLRRADQISERDFNLKKEQVENERSYRDAMAEYYRNIPNVQKEIAQMREDGRSVEIETRLREVALAAVLPYRSIFQTEAEDELPSNATARQIQDLADRKFQAQVNMFVNMAKAPQTSDSEIEDLVQQYRSR